MNENERAIASLLSNEPQDAAALAAKARMHKDSVMSIIATLEMEGLAEVSRDEREHMALTAEGEKYYSLGTPEKRLYDAVSKPTELAQAIAHAQLDAKERGIALQWALKRGVLKSEKQGTQTILSRAKEYDGIERTLDAVKSGHDVAPVDVLELLGRKLAEKKVQKTILVKKTAKSDAVQHAGPQYNQLTPEMLKSGAWRDAQPRPYDLARIVGKRAYGKKHYYQEFLNEVRGKLVGMGFREERGPLVETEFWNLDSLYMAQDHPAREIHDVFHMGGKGHLPDGIWQKVRDAHEKGGTTGSTGWQYHWSQEIAARLILRSQTTAVTARAAASHTRMPDKAFSLGRVFRPDEIDWSHFIEFNQVDGIIIDESASFRGLLGFLKESAYQLAGASNVKFVPSYFPFTEPSVEMMVDIPGKGWTEVGGAGMFRPELLEALGINVPVIAWAWGIDRMAMLKLKSKDIRDLNTKDIAFLKEQFP